MNSGPPLRVLIVDDSRIFRGVIEQALAGNQLIKVMGSVWSGEKALELARLELPDFVTLDLQMPGLSGLETLKALRELSTARQQPLGVLLISSLTQRGAAITIEGLQEGAFDFITKPDGPDAAANFSLLKEQLSQKVSLYRQRPRQSMAAAVQTAPTGQSTSIVEGILPLGTLSGPHRISSSAGSGKELLAQEPSGKVPAAHEQPGAPAVVYSAVVIGSSTGGPEALCQLLPSIVRNCPVPLFLVQHLPVGFTHYFASSLERRCGSPVIEARTGLIPKAGELYVAPAGQHLLLERNGRQVSTVLNQEPAENGCRPAADVLFRSAANAYAGPVLGVVLTGMGTDGAKGAMVIKQAGGHVIVQDEATSVVWGMPGSTFAAGAAHEVLPLGAIAGTLRRLLKFGGETA